MSNEELVLQIQAGNDKSKNLERLYLQNKGLIGKIALKYSRYEDIEDLIMEGYFGLVTAAEYWSPDKEVTFATYAFVWIRQAIRRYLDNCGSVVRIPTNQKNRIFRYRKAVEEFIRDKGRNPNSWELVSVLDLPIEQIESLEEDVKFLQLRSTDEIVIDDLTLGDTVPDPDDKFQNVLDKIEAEQLSSLLWSLVDELKEIEAVIIKKRYKDGRTLRQCGEDLGLEYNRVHSLEQGAMNKLRRKSNIEKLKPFIEERRVALSYQRTGLQAFRTTGTSSPERAAMLLYEEQYRKQCKDRFEEMYRQYLRAKYS